jgi:hypothetical protein
MSTALSLMCQSSLTMFYLLLPVETQCKYIGDKNCQKKKKSKSPVIRGG